MWVERLLAHEQACRSIVGGQIYRTWVLYLAASALSFEAGLTDIHQVLLANGSSPGARHWTRAYLYA
jgi:cyclopropane-fatty-acyl-phospholipid synthase